MFLARALLMPDTYSSRERMQYSVHAHLVHAVLHHAFQRLAQTFLVHIMLVLAHADGLRRYLHQLRERSCRRRPRLMAPRVVTSRSGYSSLASLEAEYTEAPASFTMV